MASEVKAESLSQEFNEGIYKFPTSWKNSHSSTHISLRSPEDDASLFLLALSRDNDITIEELAKIALRTVSNNNTHFSIKLCIRLPESASFWAEEYHISFNVPPSEHRHIFAVCRCIQDSLTSVAYITVYDGSERALARRGAQIQSISESWKPRLAHEEDLSGHKAKIWTKKDVKEYEDFIQMAMTKIGLPGCAIIIVDKGSQIILRKGFGVKQAGFSDPILPSTLFRIGSTTKSLTSMLMAKLISDGTVSSWETPIISVLPEFKLGKESLQNKITFKLTVSASTGFPRQDAEFLYKKMTAEENLASMAVMVPTTGFGEVFQYSNPLVAAGGWAAGRAYAPNLPLFDAYVKAMKDNLFDPLEMTNTFWKLEDVEKVGDFACPHGINIDGSITSFDPKLEDILLSIIPSGGAWSNIDDIAKSLMLDLNGGALNGKEFIKRRVMEERYKPAIKISQNASYGLGLFLDVDRGIRFIGHGGNTLGSSCDHYFLPDHGIGTVVLMNCNHILATGFGKALREKFLEITFGAKERSTQTLVRITDSLLATESLYKSVDMSSDKIRNVCARFLGKKMFNNDLGFASIEQLPDDSFILNLGDMQSQFGIETDSINGTQFIVITSAHLNFFPTKLMIHQDEIALTMNFGQNIYDFKCQ